MQEKLLATISVDILSLNYNCNGKTMKYVDYLKSEVFPYLDLKKKTVMLKSGIELSLKDFIEQSVLYTCQNRYHGDFIEFAKDNIVQDVKAKKENKDINKSIIGSEDKTYVFYEELSRPKYLVVMKSDGVVLICRDGKSDIIMKDLQDKKEFLKRIKKLDLDLFVDIYHKQEIFKDYVDSFSKDKAFYNSLMVGILNKSSFDNEYDKCLEEISELIDLVDNGEIVDKENIKDEHMLDISVLPLFDDAECLDVMMKKCRSYYSEFTSDVDRVMEQNSVSEMAEYVLDEYLVKAVNHKFYDYVKMVVDMINNGLEITLNNNFITEDLEETILGFKSNLKRLFVNSSSKSDTVASDIYIDIIVEYIQDKLFNYEEVVNNAIKSKLTEMNICFKDNDSRRVVS